MELRFENLHERKCIVVNLCISIYEVKALFLKCGLLICQSCLHFLQCHMHTSICTPGADLSELTHRVDCYRFPHEPNTQLPEKQNSLLKCRIVIPTLVSPSRPYSMEAASTSITCTHGVRDTTLDSLYLPRGRACIAWTHNYYV